MGSSADLSRLAFDQALRALDKQDEALRELRSRTGVLLAASALVASFLGARALAEADSPWLTIGGLMMAVATILSCVLVLVPRAGVSFSLDGPALYEHFVGSGIDLVEAHRTLAYWIQGAWDGNQRVIDGLLGAYRFACGALTLEVLLWSLELAVD